MLFRERSFQLTPWQTCLCLTFLLPPLLWATLAGLFDVLRWNPLPGVPADVLFALAQALALSLGMAGTAALARRAFERRLRLGLPEGLLPVRGRWAGYFLTLALGASVAGAVWLLLGPAWVALWTGHCVALLLPVGWIDASMDWRDRRA
ncbi:MAG: hypothetical protein ACK47B_14820 [Armatimonadota bacterium]